MEQKLKPLPKTRFLKKVDEEIKELEGMIECPEKWINLSQKEFDVLVDRVEQMVFARESMGAQLKFSHYASFVKLAKEKGLNPKIKWGELLVGCFLETTTKLVEAVKM